MVSKLPDKKRKSRASDSESDDELANGLFDGVLSQSEDEEDYIPSDDGGENEDDDESGSEGTDGSEDEEEDEDDAILSDDIPSDNDAEDEPEIVEPGVDPKPNEDEKDEMNYRIETDANGGVRYVYECVYG